MSAGRGVRAVAFDAVAVVLDIGDGSVSALIGGDDPDFAAGSMVTGVDPGPNWGTRIQPVALDEPAPACALVTGVAAFSLFVVLAVAGLGRRRRAFARHLALLRTLAALRLPIADGQQIADSVAAVRRIGRLVPFRVACLEEATATVLVLALRGRSATWCHGIAPDPVRLHAWVAGRDGTPVAESPETWAYTTVLRVANRRP